MTTYKRRNVPPVYDAAWFAAEFGNVQRAQATGPYLPLSGGTVTGNVMFSPDDMYDIGAMGVTRPRNIYAAGTIDAGTDLISRRDTYVVASLIHEGTKVGFYNATPATKPTITGSRGANVALASLLTALATLGLITDSTTI